MKFATAKLRYGRVVVVTPEGWDCGVSFRPLTPEEVSKARESGVESDGQLALALQLCEDCVIGDVADFTLMVDIWPLCVTGPKGILARLSQAAADNQNDMLKRGVQAYRASERNLGEAAANLLAYQSYNGGAWNEKQFAGALCMAEGIMNTRNLANMVQSYMKAMSKRGR